MAGMVKRLLIASAVMLSAAQSAMAQQPGYFLDTSGAYATAFTMSIVDSGPTASFILTPTGKPWGPHLVATPSATAPGTFSPATIVPVVGSSDPITFTFTPAASGQVTLNATVGPTGATSGTFTVNAVAGSAFLASGLGGQAYTPLTSAMYPAKQPFSIDVFAKPDALSAGSGANQFFASIWSQYNDGKDDLFAFFLDDQARLNLAYFTPTMQFVIGTSTASLQASDISDFKYYRVTVAPDAGSNPRTVAITFAMSVDGSTYTTIGSPISGIADPEGTSLAMQTSPSFVVGGYNGDDNHMAGKFKRLRFAINGTMISDLSFVGRSPLSASTVTDAQGATWSIVGGAALQ